ncbi:YdcH family protein [Consotaella salsifontis]|uniref:DUF465 domain-containing protein n=1 Tax=Consotaella salsifontis TaxID=1365950 RepID=A0A1T4T415_9HYPH|nr:DUF465 domain-containing protein [Consotaella salsifontis]SKA34981.1 hypothetical protein SAMN05428963_11833 [Consotaella salsifontis]
MSLDSHLATLERRHAALDSEIIAAQGKPAVSDMDVQELKRKKLQLKDEIEKLRSK